jgi:hypothetical protein
VAAPDLDSDMARVLGVPQSTLVAPYNSHVTKGDSASG